jgi:hypothetical protein
VITPSSRPLIKVVEINPISQALEILKAENTLLMAQCCSDKHIFD